MADPLRIVVLLSGGGTTLQNILDRIHNKTLAARVVHVIANKSDAYGLVRATQTGIPTSVVTRKSVPSSESFSERIFDICREARAELVCLAGFMQFLPIPADFEHRVMNIHPSLLPAFGGKGMYGHHVHEAALKSGAKVSGCTVHFADNEYDHGPIIVQRAVPVLADDTPDRLAARVFVQECEAYPDAIRAFAEKRIRIEDRRVHIE